MDNSNVSQYPEKKSKMPIVFLIVGVVVFLVGVVVGIFVFNKSQLSNEVKNALVSASAAMEEATKGGNGYPSALPYDQFSTEAVKLDGSTSFDGTSYCIVGTHLKDEGIVYHIESTAKKPVSGPCAPSASLTTLQPTGDLVVTAASSDRIGFSWRAVPFAAEYTLQCATNKDFAENLVIVTSQSLTGTCGGLLEGKTYYARVKAVAGSINSDWSAVSVNATTTLPKQ